MNRERIANKLKTLRKSKGETQEEVAEAVKISGSSYAAYELGVRMPRDDVKERLSKHFDRSIAFIFFK